ncbi:MYND-type zinc finger protein samB [Smittium culicis]|uniref:MYND-type zinc finger protein samB n=1 Tax=Smittium culicis TaxID=133412 RepID=A0A1R1Y0E9_9FUNG|nr:MYND-type zinc finger protein samB [Smittium culicis]
MRESNFNFPITNKACVAISSALYDRRALDCTAILPLVNSLWNLGFLTQSSNRIREILTTDGGLERLVRILKTSKISQDSKDSYQTWKWLMAYHCIINMGIRGSEEVRTRVVQAGAVSIIVNILEAYLKKMKVIELGKQINQIKNIQSGANINQKNDYPFGSDQIVNQTIDPIINADINRNQHFDADASSIVEDIINERNATTDPDFNNIFDQTNRTQNIPQNPSNNNTNTINNSFNNQPPYHNQTRVISHNSINDSSFALDDQNNISNMSSITAYVGTHHVTNNSLSIRPFEHNRLEIHQMEFEQAQKELQMIENVMFRPEDVVLSLQLLAYVSKYAEVRRLLHSVSVDNSSIPSSDRTGSRRIVDVFSIAEKFTSPGNLDYMQGWAGIIMGNMCRKDEKHGGIRKCAYIYCPEWETTTKKFAKCKTCRKAKYCSRACQSKAWSSGHKHWCVERQRSNDSSENTCSVIHPFPLTRENAHTPSPAIPAVAVTSQPTTTQNTPHHRTSRLHRSSTQMPYQTNRNNRVSNNNQRDHSSLSARPRNRQNFNNIRPISATHPQPSYQPTSPQQSFQPNSPQPLYQPNSPQSSQFPSQLNASLSNNNNLLNSNLELPPVRPTNDPSNRNISLPSIRFSRHNNTNSLNSTPPMPSQSNFNNHTRSHGNSTSSSTPVNFRNNIPNTEPSRPNSIPHNTGPSNYYLHNNNQPNNNI